MTPSHANFQRRTDGGVALVASGAAAAEGDAVQQAHVVAHDRRLADDDARRVVNQDAAPDPAADACCNVRS